MTPGEEPHDERGSSAGWEHSGRTWQHPSEVGLATRGTVDRRRSTKIASVVLIGGVALLISTVMIGRMDEPQLVAEAVEGTALPSPIVPVSSSLDDEVRVAAGIVIDERGHVAVDPTALGPLVAAASAERSPSIWVERHDGRERAAEVLGIDPTTGLMVLRADDPAGLPAVAAERFVDDEQLSIVPGAGGTAGQAGTAEVAPAPTVELLGSFTGSPATFSATLVAGRAPAGSWLFDERGDLAGLTVAGAGPGRGEVAVGSTVDVLSSASLLASVRRFAAATP